MRISDWSSDVCFSDLSCGGGGSPPSTSTASASPRASPAELRIQCGKRPWRRIEATGRPVSMIRKRGSEDACMASIIPVGAARVAGGVDPARYTGDRKSVVEGQSVSVRVDHGGRRIIKNKKHI